MKVKIYKPQKTVTQAGLAKFKHWYVEFPKDNNLSFEPLMGWHKSDNTHKQIQLKFDTLDQALHYVKKNKLDYILINEKQKKFKIKSYSDNFKYNRLK